MKKLLVFYALLLPFHNVIADCTDALNPDEQTTLDPERLAFAKKIFSEISQIQTLQQAYKGMMLDSKKITNKKNVQRVGLRHLSLETATLKRGRKSENVFIKIPKTSRLDFQDDGIKPNVSYNEIMNEIRMNKLFSALGWSPDFKGILETEDKRLGLVFQNIEGKHVEWPADIPPLNKEQKNKAIAKLTEMKNTAKALGIAFYDLQFRIDNEGNFYVVDCEGHYIPSPGRKKSGEIKRGLQQVQDYIDYLNRN